MIRKFFKDAAILTFANVTTRLMGLVMFPIYARYLAPEDYGLSDYLFLIGAVFIVVFSAESHQGLLRLLPTYRSEARKRELCSSLLIYNVAVVGAATAAIAIAAYVFDGRMLGIETAPEIIAAAASSWFLLALNQQFLAIRRADLDTPAIAVASIFGVVASIAVGIVLIVILNKGVLGLIVSAASGSAISLLVLWVRSRERVRFVVSGAALREAFRFSLPLVVSSIGAVGWIYTDRYITKEFLGLHEVGLLGVAYRFGAVVALLTSAIGMALNPLVYALHEREGTADDVARLFHYFVAAGALVLACLAGYGELFLTLIAPAEYGAAAPLLPLVAAALILTAGYQFFPGLILVKKTVTFGAIQVIGLALNVVLSIVLVTRYGVVGVCVASIVTSLAVLSAIFSTGQRWFRVRCNWTRVFFVGTLTGLIVTAVLVQGESTPAIQWIGYGLPGIVLLLIFGSGLISVREARSWFARQGERENSVTSTRERS